MVGYHVSRKVDRIHMYLYLPRKKHLPMLSDILRILFGQSYKIDTRRSWRKKGDHFSRIGFNL